MDRESFRHLQAVCRARENERMRVAGLIESAIMLADDDATDVVSALVELAYKVLDPK